MTGRMAHSHDVGRAKHVPRELGGRQTERSADDDDAPERGVTIIDFTV